MGLFSSKKKTVVGTTVSRVVDDPLLPNSVRTGLTRALLSKDAQASIPEYMISEFVDSIGFRAERMYEYAKRSYTWGLPTGGIHLSSEGQAAVTAVLSALEGAAVTVEYSQFGPPNLLHQAWMQIIALYGYDPATNALDVGIGQPVYLQDMVIKIPAATIDQYQAGALDQWGLPPTAGPTPSRPIGSFELARVQQHSPVSVSTLTAVEAVSVEYTWFGPKSVYNPDLNQWIVMDVIQTGSITVPLAGLADDQADYFHVKYQVGATTKYWMYRHGAGTYPSLDALFTTPPSTAGSFFPFAYFRFGKQNQANAALPGYHTSRKLVKYLGMDYDEIAAAIDGNPDIADVEQAMLMMAVPAQSTNQLELRYLFDFFTVLHGASGTSYQSPAAAQIARSFGYDFGPNAITIEDSRFKMVLSHRGIYRRRVPGSIGAIGHHTCHVDTQINQVPVSYETEAGTVNGFDQVETKHHVYRRQISVGMYEELKVTELVMAYNILDGYYATSDETESVLMVPLDRAITADYSVPDRETLYARSLHFVFNSVQVVKIKWYQQAFFQFLMVVVAVVITVLSYGSSAQALAAAVAAGSSAAITAAVLTLVIDLMIGMLVSLAFKLFVKVVGIEAAFVVAIIAAVAGGYIALDAGGLAGAPWAKELLQLATGLTSGIQNQLGDLMGALMGEAAEFGLLVDASEKALTEANKLLETNNYLSPFVIFGESPEEFFNRTVHSGNIGIVGISAISSYVDTALRLPKLNDTLGDLANDAAF